MIKYGLKEFARNIYSNIFIAVQLAIAFIIMTAAVSSVLSRIEMYTPVKKYFPDGKGLYICNIYDTAPLDSELKNIDDVESVTSGYDTSLYYSPSSKHFTTSSITCGSISAQSDVIITILSTLYFFAA